MCCPPGTTCHWNRRQAHAMSLRGARSKCVRCRAIRCRRGSLHEPVAGQTGRPVVRASLLAVGEGYEGNYWMNILRVWANVAAFHEMRQPLHTGQCMRPVVVEAPT